MKWFYDNRIAIMMMMGVILVTFGCVLLMLGFYANPVGEIDTSVLVAYGEILTFAGTVMGISSSFKSQLQHLKNELKKDTDNV